MKLLDEYFKIQKQVHEYFGYVEDWVAIPLDDCTKYYWKLDQSSEGYGEVNFYDSREAYDEQDDSHTYSHDIYTQRFLPKWVYRGKEYTMIVVDTRVDGNKFLAVYDNAKEIHD